MSCHINDNDNEKEDTTEVELTNLFLQNDNHSVDGNPTKKPSFLLVHSGSGDDLKTCATSESSFYSANQEEEEDDESSSSSSSHSCSTSTYENKNREVMSLIQNIRGGGRGGAASVANTAKSGKRTKKKNKQKQDKEEESKASMTSSVFNLVNNVAGAGILALSAGMTGGTGWIPATLLVVLLGFLSSHSFKIIGDACEVTGEEDFKGLWARTIGPQTTYVVDSMIAIMCLAAAIIYSGILGDVFTPLLEQAGLPDAYNGRTSNIIAITTILLLPLSLIKNLSALAFTSVLGFTAIAYTVFFVVVRALDGSYKLGSGRFVELLDNNNNNNGEGLVGAGTQLLALPSFEKTSLWGFGFTSLVLMSNLGLAFIAHYNAPVFYRQLKGASSEEFHKLVNISFTILVLLYITTMIAGYATFGDVCRGNLLLNYHPKDLLSTMGRLATGFSILFGFPLVMCGARESIAGAAAGLGFDQLGHDRYHLTLVTTLLAFITLISCSVEDVSLVVGLTGAAMGAFIVYICPPILYARAVKLISGDSSQEYGKAKKSLLLVPFGIFCGSMGVYMTIKKAMAGT